jgi:hypothetical protein
MQAAQAAATAAAAIHLQGQLSRQFHGVQQQQLVPPGQPHALNLVPHHKAANSSHHHRPSNSHANSASSRSDDDDDDRGNVTDRKARR